MGIALGVAHWAGVVDAASRVVPTCCAVYGRSRPYLSVSEGSFHGRGVEGMAVDVPWQGLVRSKGLLSWNFSDHRRAVRVQSYSNGDVGPYVAAEEQRSCSVDDAAEVQLTCFAVGDRDDRVAGRVQEFPSGTTLSEPAIAAYAGHPVPYHHPICVQTSSGRCCRPW